MILSVAILETLSLVVWKVVKTKTMQSIEVTVCILRVLNVLAFTVE